MNIAVIDDDIQCQKRLSAYISRFVKEENITATVVCYSSGIDFCDYFFQHDKQMLYDLVLLDINMPHFSGMETAQKIREFDDGVDIAFVTEIATLARQGYGVSAIDYLVKPIVYADLCSTLKKSLKRVSYKDDRQYLVKFNGGIARIPHSDITLVEGDGHFCNIYTKTDTIKIRKKVNQIENELGNPTFVRCGVSYLVNLKYVTSVRQNVAVVDKREVVISRPRRKELMEKLITYFGGKIDE